MNLDYLYWELTNDDDTDCDHLLSIAYADSEWRRIKNNELR